MLDVVLAPGDEVVQADDVAALGQEAVAEVGTEEPGPTRDDHPAKRPRHGHASYRPKGVAPQPDRALQGWRMNRPGGVTFGQRLRRVRLHAGLSQSALETRSGIPKARLSRYENGHVLPSIETLGRLATALGVSEARLLGDQRAILEEFFNVLF